MALSCSAAPPPMSCKSQKCRSPWFPERDLARPFHVHFSADKRQIMKPTSHMAGGLGVFVKSGPGPIKHRPGHQRFRWPHRQPDRFDGLLFRSGLRHAVPADRGLAGCRRNDLHVSISAFIQFRGFRHSVQLVRGDYLDPNDAGEVTPFQALGHRALRHRRPGQYRRRRRRRLSRRSGRHLLDDPCRASGHGVQVHRVHSRRSLPQRV